MKRSITWGITITLTITVLLCSFASAQYYQQERQKNICKATHLGPMAISVTCLNGADPTGTKIGDTLIISCGK